MDSAQTAVLLVEDDQQVRVILEDMLLEHGFRTFAAETAEQGLLAFESHPGVSLAILDMVLPGGDSGLDLAAELERRRPGFPILYISGLVDSIAMECIARRDPERVLLKPFVEETLIQRVRALLSGKVSHPGPGHSTTPAGSPVFPWERLVEASDRLAGPSARVMSYRDTPAGYAIAIVHVAVLRAACMPYAFAPTGDPAMPLALTVGQDDRAGALRLIEHVGLGADIAFAA